VEATSATSAATRSFFTGVLLALCLREIKKRGRKAVFAGRNLATHVHGEFHARHDALDDADVGDFLA